MTPESAVPVTGVCELVLEQSDLAAAEHFYAHVLGRGGPPERARGGRVPWLSSGF